MIGPGTDVMVACANHDGRAFAPSTVIINGTTGAVLTTINNVGFVDETWYNPGDGNYYLAARDMPSGPVLGVINATTRQWLLNVPTNGNAHSVDSSDFAFRMAGGLALREAAAATKMTLLEPIDEISVLVPDDFVGAVMGDLSSRRGRVLGTDTAGHERTVVKAEVPQVELARYATDLRSLAHGAASFTRSFVRYEPMPESAAAKVKTSAS